MIPISIITNTQSYNLYTSNDMNGELKSLNNQPHPAATLLIDNTVNIAP